MKVKENAQKLFTLFSEDPLHFFGSGIVVALVSFLSLGVFALPVYSGFLRMFESVTAGNRPDFNMLFSRMNRVVSMFVLFIIIVSTIALGSLLIIPGIMIAALWLYAPLFMEFEGLDVQESLKKSARLAIDNNYVHHLILTLVLAALNSLGGYLVIGWIITLPFTAGFIFLLYTEFTKKRTIKVQEDSASLT